MCQISWEILPLVFFLNGLEAQPYRYLLTFRSIVIAWQKFNVTGIRVPYLFRSYRHPKSVQGTYDVLERNPDVLDEYQIWQVGRATAAAPTYFKAVKLEEEDDKTEYIDGGFGANNPTEEAYRSVKQLKHNDPRAVQVLVSIGTGKNLETDPNPSAGYSLYLLYMNAAAKWATQSEATHHNVADATNGMVDYFRLNVEHGLGKMKLDAWKGKRGSKTLGLIRTKTQEYLESPDGKQYVSGAARRLVEVRQSRSTWRLDPDHWERFCHGVEYACRVSQCSWGERRWERQGLRRHLEEVHPSHCNANRLESLLDAGRCFPQETTP